MTYASFYPVARIHEPHTNTDERTRCDIISPRSLVDNAVKVILWWWPADGSLVRLPVEMTIFIIYDYRRGSRPSVNCVCVWGEGAGTSIDRSSALLFCVRNNMRGYSFTI